MSETHGLETGRERGVVAWKEMRRVEELMDRLEMVAAKRRLERILEQAQKALSQGSDPREAVERINRISNNPEWIEGHAWGWARGQRDEDCQDIQEIAGDVLGIGEMQWLNSLNERGMRRTFEESFFPNAEEIRESIDLERGRKVLREILEGAENWGLNARVASIISGVDEGFDLEEDSAEQEIIDPDDFEHQIRQYLLSRKAEWEDIVREEDWWGERVVPMAKGILENDQPTDMEIDAASAVLHRAWDLDAFRNLQQYNDLSKEGDLSKEELEEVRQAIEDSFKYFFEYFPAYRKMRRDYLDLLSAAAFIKSKAKSGHESDFLP
jgi:hypothetical protein